jgi:hypothetical protein
MDARLIGRRELKSDGSRRDRGLTPAVLAAALATVAALAFAHAANPPTVSTFESPLTRAPSLIYLGQTKVPAPPSSYGLRLRKAHPGSSTFVPVASLSAAGSAQLYSFFLNAMSSGGWTLLGKGDPTPAGDWTLRWQYKAQAVLLTMYTSPAAKLTISLCPPAPYC